MKSCVLAAILTAGTALSASAATIYSEEFTGQDGLGIVGGDPIETTTGSETWSLAGNFAGLSASDDWIQVVDGRMEGRDLDAPVSWLSPIIDISGFTNLMLSILFIEDGDFETADYLDVSTTTDMMTTLHTNVNGFGSGTHSLIGDIPDDNDFGSTTFAQALVDGSQMRIQIDMFNGASTERWQFDNILLTGDAVAAVPVPAAGVMLLSGLAGAFGLRKRKSAA